MARYCSAQDNVRTRQSPPYRETIRVNVLHGRKSMSWAKSVLPLFTGTSSETFRKVPDRVQIDTTLNRQNRVQNHPFIGRHRLLNRTAVVEVTEQGRDYSALWNALLARSFQHDLQKMHDVRVINPLCHFFQQPVVPDIVKVGSQVKVEDARLPLDNCLGYSLDRVMCCPLGPISKRSRLEIRLEDRFEYELERALHHPVPDRRYRKDADFAPILRYLLPPGWEWLVGTPRQFVPQLLEQSLRALRLNGLEGHPVYSRSPIVLFGHLIRCAQGLL